MRNASEGGGRKEPCPPRDGQSWPEPTSRAHRVLPETGRAGPSPPPPLCPLTDGSCEVHRDLVRGQGPFPDDKLIESSDLITLGLVLLRPDHEVDAGLPVGMRHFAAWVGGAQVPTD